MTQEASPRLKEFGTKLAALMSEYSDANTQGRMKALFFAYTALLQSMYTGKLPVSVLAKICAGHAERLVALGLVGP